MKPEIISQLASTVHKILSDARASKTDWRKSIGFTVNIDGHEWRNEGGANGNPWDLWLVRSGTAGRRSLGSNPTFIRIDVYPGDL